jgi:hypothetical protein
VVAWWGSCASVFTFLPTDNCPNTLVASVFQLSKWRSSHETPPKIHLIITFRHGPRSLNLFSLKMEVKRSSETSVFTKATKRHVSKDCILHCHRRESLRCYIALTGWAL